MFGDTVIRAIAFLSVHLFRHLKLYTSLIVMTKAVMFFNNKEDVAVAVLVWEKGPNAIQE